MILVYIGAIMEIQKFIEISKDKHIDDYQKMDNKYKKDFKEYLNILKAFYYKQLPLKDFKGNKLVYTDLNGHFSYDLFKKMYKKRDDGYGIKNIEEEMIATAKIEGIDFSKDSVRSILSGNAPKEKAEERIYGLKKGFEFILAHNTIDEVNIYKLYQLSIGNYLDDDHKLLNDEHYRHDAVYVVGSKLEHTGIEHTKLNHYMNDLIAFINADDEIDDLTKGIIIHFYLAYLHPYFDGNGRFARLIHLWFLLERGYGSALFMPFSLYIEKSRKEYYAAFKRVENNQRYSGIIDVTPFINYFKNNVYNKIEDRFDDLFDKYGYYLDEGNITPKEDKLFKYVISKYGTSEFSTKQLEKDYKDAAYATIRGFVLKFAEYGLLKGRKYKNRMRYKVVE